MATLKERKKKAEEELKAARDKLRKIEDVEALRIGKIAISTGLADVSISDNDLILAFKEIAGRFQKQQTI